MGQARWPLAPNAGQQLIRLSDGTAVLDRTLNRAPILQSEYDVLAGLEQGNRVDAWGARREYRLCLQLGDLMKPVVAGMLVAAALLPAAAAAQGQESHTGTFMLPYCQLAHTKTMGKNLQQMMLASVCVGMVSQGLRMAVILEPRFKSCPPNDATHQKALETVVKFLEDDRTKPNLDNHLSLLITSAFRVAWPCPPMG